MSGLSNGAAGSGERATAPMAPAPRSYHAIAIARLAAGRRGRRRSDAWGRGNVATYDACHMPAADDPDHLTTEEFASWWKETGEHITGAELAVDGGYLAR